MNPAAASEYPHTCSTGAPSCLSIAAVNVAYRLANWGTYAEEYLLCGRTTGNPFGFRGCHSDIGEGERANRAWVNAAFGSDAVARAKHGDQKTKGTTGEVVPFSALKLR